MWLRIRQRIERSDGFAFQVEIWLAELQKREPPTLQEWAKHRREVKHTPKLSNEEILLVRKMLAEWQTVVLVFEPFYRCCCCERRLETYRAEHLVVGGTLSDMRYSRHVQS